MVPDVVAERIVDDLEATEVPIERRLYASGARVAMWLTHQHRHFRRGDRRNLSARCMTADIVGVPLAKIRL